MKGQFTRDAQEKSELELIIRSLREELDVAKSQLNDTRYDLKEAKFELAQVQTKCDKLNEERKLMESVHRTQQLELQLKMESSLKRNEEKSHLFSIETEKLAKVAEKLVKDVSSDVGRHQALRTHLHLLEKLAVGLNKMKDINSGASSVSSIAELKASMSLREVRFWLILDISRMTSVAVLCYRRSLPQWIRLSIVHCWICAAI